jgi:hypothetical protein
MVEQAVNIANRTWNTVAKWRTRDAVIRTRELHSDDRTRVAEMHPVVWHIDIALELQIFEFHMICLFHYRIV